MSATKPDQPLDAITEGRVRAVAAWKALRSPRLGMRGYLCVLGFFTAGPATSIEVAEAFGFKRQSTRELVNRMGELGLAHTSGFVRTGRSGPLTPLWVAGPGPVLRGGVPCRQRFTDLMQLARVLDALQDPHTVKHLASELGACERIMRDLMRIGRALNLAHIIAWDQPENQQGGGVPVACWVIGPGRDAPRPKPVGNAATKRKWYARSMALRRSNAVLAALRGSGHAAADGAAA